jgi:hypothetical protein
MTYGGYNTVFTILLFILKPFLKYLRVDQNMKNKVIIV